MGMRHETNETERNKHDEIEVKYDRQRLKRWISKDYPLETKFISQQVLRQTCSAVSQTTIYDLLNLRSARKFTNV